MSSYAASNQCNRCQRTTTAVSVRSYSAVSLHAQMCNLLCTALFVLWCAILVLDSTGDGMQHASWHVHAVLHATGVDVDRLCCRQGRVHTLQ